MKKNIFSSGNDLPDLEMIDLDLENPDLTDTQEETDEENLQETDEEDPDEEYYYEEAPSKKGIRRFLNIHVLLLTVLVLVVVICVFRFKNWGVTVRLDEIFQDGQGTYVDTFDQMTPLLDENLQPVQPEELSDILVFGNAPFADDRGSEENLANMLAELTGATVHNCSIGGSYLSCNLDHYDREHTPWDGFSFYWLACHASGIDMSGHFNDAEWALSLIDQYPEEAPEVIDTLTNLDYDALDAIVIMYDASDYYIGRGMYNDGNRTDVTTFCGALEAGIEVLQQAYPHVRIIVMSPTYAFAVNEQGEYVSSDQYTYGNQDVFSTYVIKQYSSAVYRNVSFVDNLYGTINENNAKKYLEDQVHLNEDGRRLLAERCEYFLNYYIKGYGTTE